MRKRSISLKWGAVLIALNTLFATTAHGADAGQELPFTDISELEPVKAASILQAAKKGLITGDPSGSFRPADTISRQELAVLLVKALKLESAPSAGAVFRDVSVSGWSASAINTVRDAGLMTGDGDGRFNPAAPVTREEMAAIFVRAVGAGNAKGGQAVQVADQANVSQWAKQYAEAALRLQLIEVSGDKLNPKGNVKREDIAGLLLDIFTSEQRTAVIDSVDGDVVTIDGTPFLIEGKLKELIGDTNREALNGAVLKFDSLNRHVDGLRELEIVQNNVVLQTAGLPANAVLSVSGNAVHIQGSVAGELQVNNGASTLIIEGGKVNQLVIGSASPVVIQGSSSVTTLTINNARAKVTLDGSMLIQTLQLPDNVAPSTLIQNYSIVQKNITQVQTASGTPVATPAPVTVTAPQPTVQPTPAPVVTPTPTPTPATTAQPTQEPGPVDPTPVDPTPVNPTPVDPTPVDPTPVDPTPVDPTPVDPTPVDPTPVDPTPVDPTPVDPTPVDPTPVDPTPVNHAPTVAGSLNNISKLVSDGVQSINLDGLFADEDNDSLTLTAVSSNTGVATVTVTDGILKVTPLNAGTTTVTATAEDGRGGTISTTLTATFTVPVNHAPTVAGSLSDISKLVSDGVQSVNLAGLFADEDNDSLTLTAGSSDPGVATVTLTDGILKVTPLNAGTTTVTVTAEDGRGGTISTTLTATFTVPINHAPTVAGSLSNISKLVGDGVQSINLDGLFADEDNDSLTLTAVSSNTGVATVTVTDGILKVTPLNAGTTTVTVTAEDGRGGTISTTLTATFTVPVNHAPTVAGSLSDISKLVGDGVQSVNLDEIFADEDNDSLTLTAVSSDPGVATVTVTDGILKVTPLNAGTTTVTVTAEDGRGGTIDTTLTATFTINNAPGATRSLGNIDSLVTNGEQNVDITGLFDDMDNDPLTVTAVSSNPGVATVTISEDTLKVTPVNKGITTITVTANDGRGGKVDTTFTATFTENTAPSVAVALSNITASVASGDQTVDLSAVFTDPDNDALTLTAVSADPGIATVTLTGNQLTVTPVAAGTTTITVTANDGRGGLTQTTFNAAIEADEQGTSGLFFSETVSADGFFQAVELYNATGQTIDGNKVTIMYFNGDPDLTDNLFVLENKQIGSRSAFVIQGGVLNNDLPADYEASFFFFDEENPLQLSLYVNDVLVDTCVIYPNQTLARVNTTTKGSTAYDSLEWNEMPSNDTSGLGKFGETEIEAP